MYVGLNRCSTVDLVSASEVSLTNSSVVQYLSVQDWKFLFDHQPILLKLTRNYILILNKIIKNGLSL